MLAQVAGKTVAESRVHTVRLSISTKVLSHNLPQNTIANERGYWRETRQYGRGLMLIEASRQTWNSADVE